MDHYNETLGGPDEFHLIGFNWDERVRAYNSTTTWFVKWVGLSGFGGDLRNDPDVPILREILMYPFLVFASFITVVFAPAKLLYIVLKLIMFRSTFRDLFVDGWNTLVSVSDAFYMTFLSPIDVFIDFFLLLPFDVFLWVLQLVTWLLINIPILLYTIVRGMEIVNQRVYWMALYFIYHFEIVKHELIKEPDTLWTLFLVYFTWPFLMLVAYVDYLWMAFGWTY